MTSIRPYLFGGGASSALIGGAVVAFVSITALVSETQVQDGTSSIAPAAQGSVTIAGGTGAAQGNPPGGAFATPTPAGRALAIVPLGTLAPAPLRATPRAATVSARPGPRSGGGSTNGNGSNGSTTATGPGSGSGNHPSPPGKSAPLAGAKPSNQAQGETPPKPSKPPKAHRAPRAPRAPKSPKPPKARNAPKPQRPDQSPRPSKPSRTSKPDQPPKPSNHARPPKPPNQARPPKPSKPGKPPKPETAPKPGPKHH